MGYWKDCKLLATRKKSNKGVLDNIHNRFTALISGTTRWAAARRNLLLDYTMQGKITEADTPTIQLSATPYGLISDPPPSPPPIFMQDALPAATLPIYPGLCQAPNMLACIPSGLTTVAINWTFPKHSEKGAGQAQWAHNMHNSG